MTRGKNLVNMDFTVLIKKNEVIYYIPLVPVMTSRKTLVNADFTVHIFL